MAKNSTSDRPNTAYDPFVPNVAVNSITKELIDHLHKEVVSQGIINQETMNKYSTLCDKAEGKANTHAERLEKKDSSLHELVANTSIVDNKERLAISKVMAMESIICNAAHNMTQVTRSKSSTPEKFSVNQFKEFIENTLDSSQDKEEGLNHLKTAKDKLLLSLVYTAHPTVFHSEFARKAEWDLTNKLEDIAKKIKGSIAKEPIDLSDSNVFDGIKLSIKEMVSGVANGNHLTPMKRVTVGEENITEKACWDNINNGIDSAILAWNGAVNAVSGDPKYSSIGPTKFIPLDIKDKEKLIQRRTWNRSADADGRELATSIELYKAIHSETTVSSGDNKKEYNAPILDLRQNSEIHRDLVSALIQRTYNNSVRIKNDSPRQLASAELTSDEKNTLKQNLEAANVFSKFCDEFAQDHPACKEDNHFIIQKLSEEDRATFLRNLLTSSKNTLVPQEIEKEVIGFNKKFIQIYSDFRDDHKLPITTSLNDLKEMYDPKEILKNPNGGLKTLFVELQDKVCKETNGADVLELDGSYQHTEYNAHRSLLNNTFKVIKSETSKEASKKDDKNGQVELSQINTDDRRILADVVKRLFVVKNALEDDKVNGKITDRYQIANFEEPADFYTMMLLMQQTGLIKIEKGVVTKEPQIGIQPLIETLKDMQEAPKMFQKLLQDPLVKSYYKERGKAEFMIGFSDGAKSAGSFASEWNAYECIKQLKHVFKEAGIENVEFFEGRGRGTERGGLIETGLANHMLPPEVAVSGIRDQTIQSDLPMDMASSHGYGTQQISGMMIGTMSAQISATKQLARLEKDPIYQKQQSSYEEAMNKISEISEAKYVKLVKNDPDSLKFLARQFSNPDRSSRTPKREGSSKKDFDSQRAISIEYGMGQAGVVIHNVGLKTALEEFAADKNNTVINKDGKAVHGHEALSVLYEQFKPFRIHVDKTVQGMEIYDPEKFKLYAEMAGVGKWADKINAELQDSNKKPKKMSPKERKGFTKEQQELINTAPAGLENVLKDIQQYSSGKIDTKTSTRSAIVHVDEIQRTKENDPIHTDRQIALNKLANALLLSSSYDHENMNIKELNPKSKKAILADDDGLHTVRNILFTTSHEIAHRPTNHRLQNAVNGERNLNTKYLGSKEKGKWVERSPTPQDLGRTH